MVNSSLSVRAGGAIGALPAAAARTRRLPRAPVFDWASLSGARSAGLPSVDELPQRVYTASGRSAIYQALLQLKLPAGSGVLVPTYHCPTMIAPVLCAGLRPIFFGLGEDGLPLLTSIDDEVAHACRALLVAHYFGLPRSLHAVRAWCDERGIAMIEDCAHAYFGRAGKRPVGTWGDYATASIAKFFPVPQAGVLASATRSISALHLTPPGAVAQLRGWVDVLEIAAQHERLHGLRGVLTALFEMKNRRGQGAAAAAAAVAATPAVTEDAAAAVEEMIRRCDMGRIGETPLWVARLLRRLLPRRRIVALRRRNYALYAAQFADISDAAPLFELPPDAAPYVFPLLVDSVERADRLYTALLERALPVFRWDRLWPGVPVVTGDVGAVWSRRVLQLLCHQDLDEADIVRTAHAVLGLLVSGTATADADG